MAIDGNNRKVLYRKLLNDPATQRETSRFSFNEWERKLSTDAEAIGRLGEFAVQKGWVKSLGDYADNYISGLGDISAPAPAPVRPAQEAKPVASVEEKVVTPLERTRQLARQGGLGVVAIPPAERVPSLTDITREQAVTPMKAPEPPEPSFGQKTKQVISDIAGGFNRAIFKAPSAIIKTGAEIGTGIANIFGAGWKAEDDYAYRLADKYDDWVDNSWVGQTLIGDKNVQSLAGDVGSGLGQIATMVAAGGGSVAQGLKSSPTIMKELGNKLFNRQTGIAFTQVFNSEYENMKNKGEDEDTAFYQALLNATATAPLENIPLANLMERAQKVVGAPLAKRMVNALTQGIEEGSQEALQQVFSNMTNNQLVELEDNIVNWSDGVDRSANAGAVVGLLLGALVGVKGGRVKKPISPTPPPAGAAPEAAPVPPVTPPVTPPVAPPVTPVSETAPVTEYEEVTQEELDAYLNSEGGELSPDRRAGVEDDIRRILSGELSLDDITDERYKTILLYEMPDAEAMALLGEEEAAPVAPAEEEGLQPGERRIGGAIVKTGYVPTLAGRPSQQTVEQQPAALPPPAPTGIPVPFTPSVSFGDIKLSPQKHIGETIAVEHNGEQKDYTITKVGTDYVLVTDENGDRISIPLYEWSRNVNEPSVPAEPIAPEAAPEEVVAPAPVAETETETVAAPAEPAATEGEVAVPEAAPAEPVRETPQPVPPAAPAPKGGKKKEAPVTPTPAAPKKEEGEVQQEPRAAQKIAAISPTNLQVFKGVVTKDPLKTKIQGVYFDKANQKIVATDGMNMVVIDRDVKSDVVINPKTGEVIKEPFPNYQAAIPTDYTKGVRNVNINDLLGKLDAIIKGDKERTENAFATITFDGEQMGITPKVLKAGLKALKDLGYETASIEYQAPNKPLLIKTKDGKTLLLTMPVFLREDKAENAISIGEFALEDIGKPKAEPAPETVEAPQAVPPTKTEPGTGTGTEAAQKAGIAPANFRDLYRINRDLFGLDRIKSFASAIAMDRMVGVMAKRAGITKAEMYGRLKFEKDTEENVLKADNALFQGTVDGKPVTLRNLDVDVVNGFYSPIEKNLKEYGKDKIKAKDWLNVVGKGDEAVFTGVRAFLEGKDPNAMVSKQEILDYMKDNRISVVEVVKDDKVDKKIKEYQDKATEKANAAGLDVSFGDEGEIQLSIPNEIGLTSYDVESASTIKWMAKEFNFPEKSLVVARELFQENKNWSHSRIPAPDVKFSQYQLEGEKENYKEVLVTLPVEVKELPSGYKSEKTAWDTYQIKDDKGNVVSESGGLAKATIDALAIINKSKGSMSYIGGHFSEPNILVHLRMNTRTDAEGNKVLFLEEVQSDWGQKGKKEGFAETEQEYQNRLADTIKKQEEVVNKEVAKQQELTGSEKENHFNNVLQPERAKLRKLKSEGLPKKSAIPTAPFVMDTNAWTKLGLKVALKEAVKQGADKIAWTTGTQQFDRWGTEKIDWVKTNKGWTINIQEQFSGTAFEGMNVDEKALSEKGTTITSKEDLKAAIDRTLSREKNEAERQKLTDRIWDRMQKEDSGTSLPRKEGMESFYGTEGTKGIVGGVAEKVFGQKVGETKIDTGVKVYDAEKYNGTQDIENIPGNEMIQAGDWLIKDLSGDFVFSIDGDLSKSEAIQEFKDTAADTDIVISEGKGVTTQPSIDITPTLRAEVERGLALFQRQQGQQAKGAMVAADGAFVIYALSDPNVSTPLHEMAHVFEHYLTDAERAAVQSWAGTKAWTTQTSEKFARGFEKYLADGKAPAPALQRVFDKFKQWLTDIYNGITGSDIDIELNDAMRGIYTKMLGEEAVKPAKPRRPSAQKPSPEPSGPSPFAPFETRGEAGIKARAALREQVGKARYDLMENVQKNAEKILRTLEAEGKVSIKCP